MIRNVIDIMLGGLDNGRTPNVQQYDVESREYECRLWEAPGVPYSLKKNALVGVVFSWRGNHGSKEYETKIENSSTVVVTVPQEAMLREGIVTMQLKVHEDDGLLHSPEIFFGVLKSIKPGDQESDEPAVMLVALVAQTQALLMEIRNALENGEFDGDDGYSPEINLTRVEGGVRIDVTNQSGTQTEYVYDGTGGTGGSTLPNVTEADEGKVLQVVNGIWAAAELKTYQGEYSVTPEPYSRQTLPTDGLLMTDDVTIHEIPYYETSNTSGGETVYIGKEVEIYGN